MGYCSAWKDHLGAAPPASRELKACLGPGGSGSAAVEVETAVGHQGMAHSVRGQASKPEEMPVAAAEQAADLDIGVSVEGYSEVREKLSPGHLR